MIFRSFREKIFRDELAEGTSPSAAFRTLYNPLASLDFPFLQTNRNYRSIVGTVSHQRQRLINEKLIQQ